jgi:hypothetical protein
MLDFSPDMIIFEDEQVLIRNRRSGVIVGDDVLALFKHAQDNGMDSPG